MVSTLISPTGHAMYVAVEEDVAFEEIVMVPAPVLNAVIVVPVGIPVPLIFFPTAIPVKSVTPVMVGDPLVEVPVEPYNPHMSRAMAAIVPSYAVVELMGVVLEVVGSVVPKVM